MIMTVFSTILPVILIRSGADMTNQSNQRPENLQIIRFPVKQNQRRNVFILTVRKPVFNFECKTYGI